MFFAGIDAGSRTIKAAVIDEGGGFVSAGLTDQGIRQAELAELLLADVLQKAGLVRGDVGRIVATGYGRGMIGFADTTITEITCHACGVYQLIPAARTVVDIGGQDSKLLRLDADGRVRDFVMNDRCAAGTGRFLEVVAARLGVGLGDLGKLAGGAEKACSISSMCVVFAETEIIGLLASGEKPENLVAGVQMAIATRIASMAGRGVPGPVIFTGGVALVPGMDQVLASVLGAEVVVCPQAQLTGALGAALLARRDWRE